MKKTIAMFALFLLAMSGVQAEETTDYISLSATTEVAPGGGVVTISVHLTGSENYYSAYNLDIHLPEYLELSLKNGEPDLSKPSSRKADSFYPSTVNEEEEEGETYYTYSYTHTFMSSYGAVGEGVLRVACVSMQNESFIATSGRLFTFKVKASPYAKPGAIDITIDGVALKVAGGAQYDPVAHVDRNITVGTSSTVPLIIPAENRWSTCILPMDAALPEGVQAFSCSSVKDETYLALHEESAMAAYTPYILYAEHGYEGTLSGTVNADNYSETCTAGYLTGAIVPQKITGGYVLQHLTDGVKFYRINNHDAFSIPAGKCWLSIPNQAGAYGFWHPTNISSTREQATTAPAYDLSGRRVSDMKAGEIYIMNGQTILKTK